MREIAYIILIVALVGVIIMQESCKGKLRQSLTECRAKQTTEPLVTITKVKPEPSTIKSDPRPLPKVTKALVAIQDTVEKLLRDTLELEKVVYECLGENIYEDTLVNDSSLFFSLKETIRGNMIAERSYTFLNRQPAVVGLPQPIRLRTRLLAGPWAMYREDTREFTGGVMLSVLPSTDNWLIGAGYDPWKKSVLAYAQMKIVLWPAKKQPVRIN